MNLFEIGYPLSDDCIQEGRKELEIPTAETNSKWMIFDVEIICCMKEEF